MAKHAHSVSDEGFVVENEIRNFDVTIDAGSGEEAPDTLETLVAAYASCFVPALRVGAKQRNVGDLGRIEIHTTGELNEDDKLDSISFDIEIEANLDDAEIDRTLDRAFELCKVHDALKESLHADADVESDAF